MSYWGGTWFTLPFLVVGPFRAVDVFLYGDDLLLASLTAAVSVTLTSWVPIPFILNVF